MERSPPPAQSSPSPASRASSVLNDMGGFYQNHRASSTSQEVEQLLSQQRDRAFRGEAPALSSMQLELERRGLFTGGGGSTGLLESQVSGHSFTIICGGDDDAFDDDGGCENDDLLDEKEEQHQHERQQQQQQKQQLRHSPKSQSGGAEEEEEEQLQSAWTAERIERRRQRRLRAKERAQLKAQLTDEENARIDEVVISIEMQQAIKEMQLKEMDLMRLTGAEMEDMWQRRDEYKYSEYRKLLEEEAAAAAKAASGAVNGEEEHKIIAGSASGVNMRRSALLERAAKREKPQLFQIVAAKPPRVQDFAALSGHLVIDELPPDAEIHEITPEGVVLPAGHRSLMLMSASAKQQHHHRVLDSSTASQDELRLMGKLKSEQQQQRQLKNEKEGAGAGASNETNDDASGHAAARVAQSVVRGHHIALIAAGGESNSRAGAGRSPPRGVDAAVYRDEDGKEIEIDVSAGAAAAGAASPHLFDCFRHARHRAIFSDAMKKRREEKAKEQSASNDTPSLALAHSANAIDAKGNVASSGGRSSSASAVVVASSTFRQLEEEDKYAAAVRNSHPNNRKLSAQQNQQQHHRAPVPQRIAQPTFTPVSMLGAIALPSSAKIFELQHRREERKMQRAVEAALNNNNNSNTVNNSGKSPTTCIESSSLPSLSKEPSSPAALLLSAAAASPHSELRKLMFEQRVLVRKAEKGDSETYKPLLRNFMHHQDSVTSRMWGGK